MTSSSSPLEEWEAAFQEAFTREKQGAIYNELEQETKDGPHVVAEIWDSLHRPNAEMLKGAVNKAMAETREGRRRVRDLEETDTAETSRRLGHRLTAREMAILSFDPLPLMRTEGQLCTHGSNTQTWSELLPWFSFTDEFEEILSQLPNDATAYQPLRIKGEFSNFPAAEESEVRTAWSIVLHYANQLANDLRLGVEFLPGGQQLSTGFPDFIVARRGEPLNEGDLSARVLATGEIKGNWQFHVPGDQNLEVAVRNPDVLKQVVPAVQQCYGDMVLNRVSIGILTNYQQTYILKHVPNSRRLEVSPCIRAEERPFLGLLAALRAVAAAPSIKHLDPQLTVKNTPPEGYPADGHQPPGAQKRTRQSSKVPRPDAKEQGGVTYIQHAALQWGQYLGVGLHAQTFQGSFDLEPAALKLFNHEARGTEEAFAKEVAVYKDNPSLQGAVMPKLLAAGTLEDTFYPLIVTAYVGESLENKMITRAMRRASEHALQALHSSGVVHNYICRSNMLWDDNLGQIFFIDFGESSSGDSESEGAAFQWDRQCLNDVLSGTD